MATEFQEWLFYPNIEAAIKLKKFEIADEMPEMMLPFQEIPEIKLFAKKV